MIKINRISNQILSKDDFILNGDYIKSVKFLGLKIWETNHSMKNEVEDENFNSKYKTGVGFGNKK